MVRSPRLSTDPRSSLSGPKRPGGSRFGLQGLTSAFTLAALTACSTPPSGEQNHTPDVVDATPTPEVTPDTEPTPVSSGQLDDDNDRDGRTENGGDCDDTNAAVNPDATEACDGLDTDCSGAANADEVDKDEDGHLICEGDCDDTNAQVNPGAEENLEDGIDNDCDTVIDDPATYDQDGDGFAATRVDSEGNVIVNDCDDHDDTIHPEAVEICDLQNNDCDDQIDEGVTSTFYADADTDGYGNPNSMTQACAAPQGYVAQSGDCEDNDAGVNPGEAEVCDDKETDCNPATTDDALKGTYYPDSDADGYGQTDGPTQACSLPEGYTVTSGDCLDTDAAVNPSATEVPYNEQDDDCRDGDLVDQDQDGQASVLADGPDCSDKNPNVYAGAVENSTADGIDSDCDQCDMPGYITLRYGSTSVCLAQYEASMDSPMNLPVSVPGATPLSISFAEASNLVQSIGHGFSLADPSIWQAGCQGDATVSETYTFSYGSSYEAGTCNTADPNGGETNIQPTGSFAGCISQNGVFDALGNVSEWTDNGALWGGNYNSSETNTNCQAPHYSSSEVSPETQGGVRMQSPIISSPDAQ